MDTSKIIKGVVGGGRYTVTAPIVKEDYGLYLKIEGLELPSTYEVDFSNQEHNGTSVTMIGNSDGVLIPHQFIDSGKDIFAFLYHVGEDYGRTIFKFRIPNKLRPDRTDEQPTPEEQSVIDQAISALNTAVAQTEQDKADADVSAQNASADAERAEEARTDAQNYATQAEQSATNASQSASQASASATASAQSASQSAQIKTDVESMAASASYQSAQTAQGYASNAQLSATQANNSAMSANQSASDALTHANTASSKATEASGYASTASAKATESAQSASQALTYKTDAESAKTASQTAQGLAESARDLAQGYAEDAQGYAEDAQASAEGISASASQIAQNTANILKAFPTDTASGAVASFSDGADDIPLKSLIVNIDPVQDTSSGDPSPENICPISGWTQVEVNHSDADMTNPTTITIDLGQTVYGGKLDVLSGVLTIDRYGMVVDGTNRKFVASGNYWRISPYDYPAVKTVSGRTDPVSVYSDITNNVIFWGTAQNGTLLFTRATNWTGVINSVDELNALGITVVYELAEPIEVQLDAHTLNSLLGQNNIFADTGDCSVEYRADTRLYIEKLTQPEEDDMVADSAITSGQFFMIGNSLYRALANIASGATITVGTNAQRVSLADALNLINT